MLIVKAYISKLLIDSMTLPALVSAFLNTERKNINTRTKIIEKVEMLFKLNGNFIWL